MLDFLKRKNKCDICRSEMNCYPKDVSASEYTGLNNLSNYKGYMICPICKYKINLFE